MNRIPIDVAAAIACTATADEIRDRIEQIGLLRDRLRDIDRTSTGLLLTFRAEPGLRATLHRFVEDEKGCCRFWGFDLTTSGRDLTLAWEGPPEVQDLLDELDRYFRSDEPLTAFSGLL